ncbi:MAG: hypothetical protein NZ556_04535 [Fimbriimonadales bacterium]|nr:hypothetical protein [Fimbriimonadales bacterium]
MAYPARQPDEKPPLWIIQETFEGDQPAEQPQDVYVLHLLRALPAELLNSLSPEQYDLLRRSLLQYHRRHLLDVRGVIPFLWTRFYFVFLFGKDTRTRQEAVAFERRARPRWHSVLGWVVMLALLALLLVGLLGFHRLMR